MHYVKNQIGSWQDEIRSAYQSINDLLNAGLLSGEEAFRLNPVEKKYSIFLTPYYAKLIDRTDPHCPIRRQAIPAFEEMDESPELSPDPLTDLKHQPVPKVTHRYSNRVLLHLTPNCSMYCRYCFRKSLLNELKEDLFKGELDKAFQYLESQTEIEEVILSGGDPLLVSDASLSQTLKRLCEIPHLKRIRIHTRVPVTCPMRITPSLIQVLSEQSKPLVMVAHFNHPKELTLEARQALYSLSEVATLLNQSVLLKGVNDSAATLNLLSEKLFETRVLPYYLHHPDKASGTKHFQISKAEGLAIYEEFKKSTSGYLVPKYVEDDPKSPFKTPVSLF